MLLEEARVEAFWGRTIDSIDEPETLWLVARQEIEYLTPIPYQTTPLDVQLWVGHLGGASLEVCYEVYTPAGSEPSVQYARAATTIALVDRSTQRSRRMNAEERATWSAWIDEPLTFTRRP